MMPGKTGKAQGLLDPCGNCVDNIGTMSTPDLEDPEQVLSYLAPAILVVSSGLDHGVSLADSFFDQTPFDPWLWSHIARYGTCGYLDGLSPGNWERGRVLANSGIELKRMPLVLRTLKARGEGPPNPGPNLARKAYWSQQTNGRPRLPIILGGAVIPEVANYILDWTTNSERELFLALSKPIGTWKYGQRPKLEWRRPFQKPEGEDDLRFIPTEEDLPTEDVFDPSEFEEGEETEDGGAE